MQTTFTPEQLRDPGVARSNEILRTCVHCGFCTATCPTYQVLGDELDSPRGRIYLIKDMLEAGRPADAHTVKHIDRCLSCLACMTTCPSGVHYMHLVDHAREHIEKTYRRPPVERALRWVLARVLPYPGRFRAALWAAKFGRPFARLMPDARLRAMLEMAPKDIPRPSPMDRPQVFKAMGARRKRVALLTGCAQRALNTDINEATVRLLTRHGCEVVIAAGMGCCGALTHHMGKTAESHATAARTIAAWMREVRGAGLDAVVINTSGCGTTVKDYGHMFRGEALAEDAAAVAGLARDVSEVMVELGLGAVAAPPLRVAYHAACSLQHGQAIKTHPKTLLKAAGFEVVEPRDAHLCCGSAGTYNLMQPEISAQLKARKVASLEEKAPQVIAAGNIGCMMQIGSGTGVPVVHTVELLDWATGGPKPRGSVRFRLALIALLAGSAAWGEQRMIADDEAAAYRAVGRLNVAGNRHCTAVLVTDRLALTAAHCLFNALTGRRAAASELKFVAGQRRDRYAALRDVAAVAMPAGFVFSREPAVDGIATDLALLALAEPIGAEAAAPFPVGAAGGPLSIVAYGRDRAYAASIRDGCGLIGEDGPVLVLDCAVTFGVSGAPVLAAGADGPEVVGIVSAMGEGPSGEIAYAVRVGDRMAELLDGLAQP